jgi:ComF family protein
MSFFWQNLSTQIADLLMPPRCAGCHSLGQWLCSSCATLFADQHEPRCYHCGTPLPTSQPEHICEPCENQAPDYDRHLSLSRYDKSVKEAIHGIKYHEHLWLLRAFGSKKSMARIGQEFSDADVIVPVPLHIKRLRERGFNQSLQIARRLQQKWPKKLPIMPWLTRTTATKTQTSKSRDDRSKNVAHIFSVSNPCAVRNKIILLVDDVHTTGATLNAAARELKYHGAKKVYCVTLAMVLSDESRFILESSSTTSSQPGNTFDYDTHS